MDIFEAIRTRRSMGLVKDEPVPEEVIHQLLEAGSWAPSHYRTEPWRFFVLTGEGRKPLGSVLAEIAKESMDDPSSETNQKKLEKTLVKPYRAPLIITVAVEPSTDHPKVIDVEEYGAVFAAIQNMLLAAHGLGLAGFWRTGQPAYHRKMKKMFGLSEKGEVLGFLYFGYPKREAPQGKRKDLSTCVKWLSAEKDYENL
ncbi:nitroreductase [Rossellomorea vietnamensis]|uniref:Putative NAD(P)H nitroreductase n=2 Tax=Rossellomorea TaxID=2837508 RepID=A0A5D4KDK3_9BACI|nr:MULTISPECIES: nitroreductase [Rossellomorea]TYR74263.1 nitroreductase [Rossellomorea vietnamensis]TYS79788.1 nitroreductase [Rossellomorea aquimaris]